MKKPLFLSSFLTILICQTIYAQKDRVIGSAEKRIADSLCNTISRLDESKINTKKEATDAFMECFSKNSALLEAVADERKISMDDNDGMHKIGIDIGKDLLALKCDGFMQLAVKMAKKDEEDSNYEEGKFKRIDSKGFNYIVITDNNNEEKSFLWLKQFPGSEKFMNGGANYTGKKISIKYQELEVYLPQAKGYYKVKEIISLDIQ